MIQAGDVIENAVTGERLVFRKTSAETNGEAVVLEAFLRPDAFVAAAIASLAEERFQVLRGSAVGLLGRKKDPRRPRPADHGSRRDSAQVLERGRGRGALRVRGQAGDAVRAADRDDVRARSRRQDEPRMPNPLHLAVIASITSTTCVFPSACMDAADRARARRPAGPAARLRRDVRARPGRGCARGDRLGGSGDGERRSSSGRCSGRAAAALLLAVGGMIVRAATAAHYRRAPARGRPRSRRRPRARRSGGRDSQEPGRLPSVPGSRAPSVSLPGSWRS